MTTTTTNPRIDADAIDSDARLRAAVESALSSGYEVIARTSSTIIVKKCLDIIERYRDDGLTFAQIAEFISEKVAPVTEIALKKAYGREVKARSARANTAPTSVSVASTTAVARPAPTPTAGAKKQGASVPPASAPARPTSLPEIPRGDLTHTERENIAIPWFAQRFGGRNPAHVQVDEVSAVELDWLEKLWDVSAPINPKTGDPFAHKAFTPGGRPTYNRPFIPPKAIPLGDDGDFVEIDDDLRENLKRYGAGLAVSEDCRTDLHTVFADGHLSVPYPRRDVTGMLRGMMPDIRKNWEKVRAAGGPAIGVR
ncbi:MAG: hypothetical protein KGL42_03820 [Betaproteobacteria bacterium]|nr:hypothetical protein [Betaproteobacteria bacterium]